MMDNKRFRRGKGYFYMVGVSYANKDYDAQEMLIICSRYKKDKHWISSAIWSGFIDSCQHRNKQLTSTT